MSYRIIESEITRKEDCEVGGRNNMKMDTTQMIVVI
jgi:hypothetical protein